MRSIVVRSLRSRLGAPQALCCPSWHGVNFSATVPRRYVSAGRLVHQRLAPTKAAKDITIDAKLNRAIDARDASAAMHLYNSLAAAESPLIDTRLSQLILLLSEQGKTDEASSILDRLTASSTTHMEPAFAHVIDACARAGDVRTAMRHVGHARSLGFSLDLITCETLVNALCDSAGASSAATRSAHMVQMLNCVHSQNMVPTAATFEAALRHAARVRDVALALRVLQFMDAASVPLSAHSCRQLHEAISRHQALAAANRLMRRLYRRADTQQERRLAAAARHPCCPAHARLPQQQRQRGIRLVSASLRQGAALGGRAYGISGAAAARRSAAAASQADEAQALLRRAALGLLAQAHLLPEQRPAAAGFVAGEDDYDDDSLEDFDSCADDTEGSRSPHAADHSYANFDTEQQRVPGSYGSAPVDDSVLYDLAREASLCAALAAQHPDDDDCSYEFDLKEVLREHADNQVTARRHADIMYLHDAFVGATPLQVSERSRQESSGAGQQQQQTMDVLRQLQHSFPGAGWEVNLDAQLPAPGDAAAAREGKAKATGRKARRGRVAARSHA